MSYSPQLLAITPFIISHDDIIDVLAISLFSRQPLMITPDIAYINIDLYYAIRLLLISAFAPPHLAACHY